MHVHFYIKGNILSNSQYHSNFLDKIIAFFQTHDGYWKDYNK